MYRSLTINNIFKLLIYIGIFLAIYQFIYNKSLWGDEAKLSLNIMQRDFLGLLKPLDSMQVAPVGFLYVVKLFTLVFGRNEMSLSLFPLLGFLGSIPLFYAFTKNMFCDKTFALYSTALFSLNPNLLFYSSEVKQYSTDVFFVLLILLAYSIFKKQKRLPFLLLVGFNVIFSNVSIFILFITGPLILIEFKNSLLEKENHKVVFLLFLWSTIVLVYYITFLRNHPSKEIQIEYWQVVNGFLPSLSEPKKIFFYIIEYVIPAFKNFLPMLKQTRLDDINISLLVLVLGLFFLSIRKKFIVLYYFISTIVFHLTISSIQIYPFSARLVNYMIPLFVITFAFGTYSSIEEINKYIRLPSILLCFPILLMLYPSYKEFPFHSRSDVKLAIEYLESNLNEKDMVFFEGYGTDTFLFYEEIGLVEERLSRKVRLNKIIHNAGTNYEYLSNISSPSWVVLDAMWGSRIPKSDEFSKALKRYNLELLNLKKFKRTYCYYIGKS